MTRVSPAEGYRRWASVYDKEPNALLALERRVMWSYIKALGPTTVVDVACGTGYWLLQLQQRGTLAFGVDACEPMLREAQKKALFRGDIAVSDVHTLPFRAAVANLVICSMALGYFHDLRQVFREFARVSKSGGGIVVSDLHPDATAAGWTRSFRIGEQRYEVDHYCHSLQNIRYAAALAGLRAIHSQTVYFGDAELPLFRDAGREHLFYALKAIPTIFIELWRKPC